MVKNIILSIFILFLHFNSYSNIRFNQKQYSDSSELKREIVVRVAHSFDGINEDESWANAKLIEKAPELLDMLIKIFRFIENQEFEEIKKAKKNVG